MGKQLIQTDKPKQIGGNDIHVNAVYIHIYMYITDLHSKQTTVLKHHEYTKK